MPGCAKDTDCPKDAAGNGMLCTKDGFCMPAFGGSSGGGSSGGGSGSGGSSGGPSGPPCTSTADCTGKCPPGATCTCVAGPNGNKSCTVACKKDADCPKLPDGTVLTCAASGYCQ